MKAFKAGWWRAARPRPSPNCGLRPFSAAIDMMVIHAISVPPFEFGGRDIEALFLNALDTTRHPGFAHLKNLRVSAHFLITRDGVVTQFVSTYARAWHAGESSFGGIAACNDRSLGIELEGADNCAFTETQYEHLIELCRALRREFPEIVLSRIVGHSDIAPGRKTDPGPYFDWIRFRAGLAVV